MTGVGLEFLPNKNAPIGEGRSVPGVCTYCDVNSLKWEMGNIEAGITLGPLAWKPVVYDGNVLVNEYKGDDIVGTYINEGAGIGVDPLNFTSVFDPENKKAAFGLNVALDANYEFSTTISRSDFWGALGLGESSARSASGGFLIYPSKINSNNTESVYLK
jgi:hypothetical protein